jgi:hypothetical protein
VEGKQSSVATTPPTKHRSTTAGFYGTDPLMLDMMPRSTDAINTTDIYYMKF